MDFLKNFRGAAPTPSVQSEDSGTNSFRIGGRSLTHNFIDFAAFDAAAAPSPVSIPSSPADWFPSQPTDPSSPVVYTKWYRVWERTKPSDFQLEAFLIPVMLLMVLIHFWGTRKNKRIARKWMAVHAPLLDSEFALVGYHAQPKQTPYPEGVQKEGLLAASAQLTGDNLPSDLLKERTAFEFQTYATGRANVAFMDVIIQLQKRFNPSMLFAENMFGMFFESFKAPKERVEAIIYAFDGQEKDFVPPSPDGEKPRAADSSYDNFVFGVINKLNMRRLRDERYDLSLTYTKDNPKLPAWATVMTESAEIGDVLLTKELVAAIERAGDALEYLIVTDQPLDKPTNLDETTSKKRLYLALKIPSNGDYTSTLPLFAAFLRMPDYLAQHARFRPEVRKKVDATREVEIKKLKKVAETEQEEERRKAAEKLKKDERDRKMKGMSAEEQRKYLEKEKERERKRDQKRITRRG